MNKEQMKGICRLSQDVYDGKLSLKGAKLKAESIGVNANSFNDYNSAWRHMLNGTRHTRSINGDLRNVMLNLILNQYARAKLDQALNSFYETILYYEQTHNTTMHKDRELLSHYKC